jgi:hypothetical protein
MSAQSVEEEKPFIGLIDTAADVLKVTVSNISNSIVFSYYLKYSMESDYCDDKIIYNYL